MRKKELGDVNFCLFFFVVVVEALDCWVNLIVRRLEFNMKKIL